MAYYRKLAGISNVKEHVFTDADNLGLDITEFSPAKGHYIFSLLQAVSDSNHANHESRVPYPDEVATSFGLNSVTKDAYLSYLRTSGFDVEAILKNADKREREYRESLSDRKNRAQEFFDLIQTRWSVTDDDVRALINAESIYDLLELTLEYADSTRARLMAVKRHTENHAMKSEVFKWLDANMVNFKSMDSAAEAITKQQPIKFRTARDWTGEWKKLRSASTT